MALSMARLVRVDPDGTATTLVDFMDFPFDQSRLNLRIPPATKRQQWAGGNLFRDGQDLTASRYNNGVATCRPCWYYHGKTADESIEEVRSRIDAALELGRAWAELPANLQQANPCLELWSDEKGFLLKSRIMDGRLEITGAWSESPAMQGFIEAELTMTREPFRYGRTEHLCNHVRNPSFEYGPNPDTPPGACNAGLGGAGILNGQYSYKTTFVDQYGRQTILGTVSNVVAPVNQQVDLAAIPIGPAGTIARKIYRCVAGAAVAGPWYHLITIPDNTTVAYTDNIADAALGGAGPTMSLGDNWNVIAGSWTEPAIYYSDASPTYPVASPQGIRYQEVWLRGGHTGVAGGIYTDDIAVTANTDYHVHAQVRVPAGILGQTVTMQVWDVTGAAWIADTATWTGPAGEWERNGFTFTTPAGCTAIRVYIYVTGPDRAAVAVYYDVDKVYLTEAANLLAGESYPIGWCSWWGVYNHYDDGITEHTAGVTGYGSHSNLFDVEDVPGDVPADTKLSFEVHIDATRVALQGWTNIHVGLTSQGYPEEAWGDIEMAWGGMARNNERSEGLIQSPFVPVLPAFFWYNVPRGMCGTWIPIATARQTNVFLPSLTLHLWWDGEATSPTINLPLHPAVNLWEFLSGAGRVSFPIGLIPDGVSWRWRTWWDISGNAALTYEFDTLIFIPAREGLFIVGGPETRVLAAVADVEQLVLCTGRNLYVKRLNLTDDMSFNMPFLGQGIRVRPERCNRLVWAWATLHDLGGGDYAPLHDVDHVARVECEYTPRWL